MNKLIKIKKNYVQYTHRGLINMFHWQNIVSRNQTTSRYRVSYEIHPFCTLHSREIHVLNRWTGWL